MSNNMSLKKRIAETLKKIGRPAHIKEISELIDDKPQSTVRGRIYENLDILFTRISKGVYWLEGVVVIEGDGRDLSMFEDGSIDAIVTDHPWDDPKSNKGGSRNFDHTYDSFQYTLEDFAEKARVLKDGAFLVENLPEENANNWEYIHRLKEYAKQCGLLYYAKVPWKKGTFVSNTGRKSKNTEDLLFFTKGKPRNLRFDKKKIKNEGGIHYMSGAAGMLPTCFDVQPTHIRQRIHQAEKPYQLYEMVLDFITLPGEIVIDQFAGSGNLGVAAMKKNRIAVLFEALHENVTKIRERIESFTEQQELLIH